MLLSSTTRKDDWIVDSEASISIVSDVKMLIEVRRCMPLLIGAINGNNLMGNCCGSLSVNGIVLQKIYYVKGALLNIIRVSDLGEAGYQTVFAERKCIITKVGVKVLCFQNG